MRREVRTPLEQANTTTLYACGERSGWLGHRAFRAIRNEILSPLGVGNIK